MDEHHQQHLPPAAGPGPRPDAGELAGLLAGAVGRVRPSPLLADAGCDGEANGRLCREGHAGCGR